MLFRRLVLILSLVTCGCIALAAAAVAAGGGLGPGKYSFTSSGAFASFGMGGKGGPAGPSWSVSVNEGLNSFKPARGGSRLVDDSTVVYVTEFDASGNGGFGCFVVPGSAFTVSHDLSTASLHATLTADEVCPGFATPIDGGKGGATYGGGDGGLPPSLRVDVTWTAKGAVNSYRNVFTFRCLNYNEDGSSAYQSVSATATGTISALDGSFVSEFANVSSGSGQLNVHNVPPDACFA